jgi:ankyrin repeat protein
MAKFLVKNGLNVNEISENKNTPVHMAFASDCRDLIEFIIF